MLNKKEIDLLIDVVKNTNSKGLSRRLLCSYKELYNKLKIYQQDIKIKNFSECIFWILNNITSIPICPTCEKRKLKFKGLDIGYQEECGRCSISKNLKKSLMKKYGVENAAHIDGIKEKKKKTCMNKYGVEHHTKLQSVQEKKKKTCMDKYGVDNVMGVKEIRKKVKQTYYKNSNFLEYAKKLAKSKGVTLLKYSKALEPVEFLCNVCNKKFTIIWNSFQQHGCVCPNCYPKYHGISKQEKDILEYIKSIINDNILENCRQIINPYELDIVIPFKKIAIEYCGLWFHSSGPNSHDNKDKDYHVKKLKLCENNNYRLITIFEDEWVLKQDIVKSKIKQILGIFDGKRIYARDCEISIINYDKKSNFLNKYHLQGDSISSINIGLFYNNELISVMTFLKLKNNDEWELSRYCCMLNTQIIGGASKLLSYFKRNYKWNKIITHSDRRWSTFEFYKKIGFKLDKITDPNYWYWGKHIIGRKHRLNYMKSKLKQMKSYNESLTEFQIMALENYSWIYDCGNYKFIMNNI